MERRSESLRLDRQAQLHCGFPFVYNTSANGNEAFLALANANPLLDRPVTVTGQPFDIHSKNSVLIVAVNKAWKLIYLFDDNILFDNYNPNQPKGTLPSPLALALHNALFKVTPVNGCLLFGALADDMRARRKGRGVPHTRHVRVRAHAAGPLRRQFECAEGRSSNE